MNQIIYNKNFSYHTDENNKNEKKNNKNNKKKFIFLLIIFSVTLGIISYLIIYNYSFFKNSRQYKDLSNKYSVLSLYSSENSVDISRSNEIPYIIGKIQIDKLNISYPILSTTNEELLKISPCRFFGPMPNKVGNLCIAGHNYNNNQFFSNIYLLKIGDIIKIFDINNNFINYSVYSIFEVSPQNKDILAQNTDNKREVTLITCNNKNKNRIIVKSKEMD